MTLASSRSSVISKRRFRFALCAMLLALCAPAEAQQPAKVPRIGFLLVGGSLDPARRDAFREGLRDLGYVEGKNITVEWRGAQGNLNRLDELAAELVRLKIDVLVTTGNAVTRAAKKVAGAIPIVTTLASDPVENGFVASLARPGGNITGLSSLGGELSGKRLELLREAVPGLRRLLLFGNSTTPGNSQTMRQAESVAKAYDVEVLHKDIQSAGDIESAFRALSTSRPDAVLMLPNAVLLLHRKRVVELALSNRLPMMFDAKEYVEIGGLVSYAADAVDLFRRSAIYVDKILKGVKPADLPVEQPKKFELVINLKTAKQIGLAIPPNLLARADKVIK